MRPLVFALVLATGLGLLLLWAADVDWSSPWNPEQQRNWLGSDFRVVMGGATQDEERLRIGVIGDNHTALQSMALNGVDAAGNSMLRYRFEDFPNTLELSLVFRRMGDEDVNVISLPSPGNGDEWFDLGSIPEWQGRITELAFAEYPTPQVVPPEQAFKSFSLVGASLASRSWKGDLAALQTDWFGQWPWSQRSVHALGRDTDSPRARSLVLFIAIACALVLTAAILILRMRRPALLRLAVGVSLLAWLLLDLQWQAGLYSRGAATETLYAGHSWPDRELHAADRDLAEDARALKIALRGIPEASRILVHSGSSFSVLRLVYHLLPMNVGVFANALKVEGGKVPPAGTILIACDAPGWSFNAATGVLQADSLKIPGEVLYRTDRAIAFRVGSQP